MNYSTQLIAIGVLVAAVITAAPLAQSVLAKSSRTMTGIAITHGGHVSGGMVGGKHIHHNVHVHAVKGTKVLVKPAKHTSTAVATY